MVGDFKATCRKRTGWLLGQKVFTYCDVEFNDREMFKAHMVTTHRAKTLQPGGGYHGEKAAPGWRLGQIAKPHPWKAPKPNAAKLQTLLAEAEALGLLTIDHPQEERTAA